MKTPYLIIGGGVAGLSAALRLTELGESPLVIEGGSYPSHKVCGEFLSPECLPILRKWDIETIPIHTMQLMTTKNSLTFPFPSPAGGLSHYKLDPSLADLATARGAIIKTKTTVTTLEPKTRRNTAHTITLSTGKSIQADHIIIATGKIPSHTQTPPVMRYIGFKTHYKGSKLDPNTLMMFSFPGAYLGVSPVEGDISTNGSSLSSQNMAPRYNIACLAKIETASTYPTPNLYIEKLLEQNPNLHSIITDGINCFDQWMVTSVPEFGIRDTPDWDDTYFIGDAALSIPPACGNGLSLGILGGILSAEYAAKHKPKEFKTRWTKQCSSQMRWAKRLHHLMLNPTLCNALIPLFRRFPSLVKTAFDLTRQGLLEDLQKAKSLDPITFQGHDSH